MSDPVTAEDSQKWNAPLFDSHSDNGFPTASHLENLQQQAYDEARAEGMALGLEEGRQELQSRMQRLDTLLQSFATPFERLDDSVSETLAELAIAIARKLLQRELSTDPAHIVSIVEDAIKLLPGSLSDVTIRLHPDDAELVRGLVAESDNDATAWTLIEDNQIEHGGCIVDSGPSRIDARTDKRFDDIVETVFGKSR